MAVLFIKRQNTQGHTLPYLTNHTYRLDTCRRLGGVRFTKCTRRQAHQTYYKSYAKQLKLNAACFFKLVMIFLLKSKFQLVKKTITISIASVIIMGAFSSCKKDYNCRCNIKYVVNGQVVGTDNSLNTISATSKDDAKGQCGYYETDASYLQQKTVEQHYCEIED